MPEASETAPRRLSGACHCGAVQFEASLDLSKTIACNCSICSAKGLILAFAPEAEFDLRSGADQLKEYRFNRHVIRHSFCTVCGAETFARATAPDGTPMVAVNVRALKNVEVAGLSPAPFDGRSI